MRHLADFSLEERKNKVIIKFSFPLRFPDENLEKKVEQLKSYLEMLGFSISEKKNFVKTTNIGKTIEFEVSSKKLKCFCCKTNTSKEDFLRNQGLCNFCRKGRCVKISGSVPPVRTYNKGHGYYVKIQEFLIF